jgi:hypothetical protein
MKAPPLNRSWLVRTRKHRENKEGNDLAEQKIRTSADQMKNLSKMTDSSTTSSVVPSARWPAARDLVTEWQKRRHKWQKRRHKWQKRRHKWQKRRHKWQKRRHKWQKRRHKWRKDSDGNKC